MKPLLILRRAQLSRTPLKVLMRTRRRALCARLRGLPLHRLTHYLVLPDRSDYWGNQP